MGNKVESFQKCGKKQLQHKKNHLKFKLLKIRKNIKPPLPNIKKLLNMQPFIAKGKKGKFPSDPNAPQRPLSGFFLFGKDNRPRIMKQVGGNVGLIGKKLGEEWKNISADVKAKYESKAKKAKTAYTAKLEKYKKTAKYNNYVEARTEYNKMKKKM